jgi:hypothetical protein
VPVACAWCGGQPPEPPDDGGHDQDRERGQRAELEDGTPDGGEGDGSPGPGEFGPFAGQPRVGVLDVLGRRFQCALTPEITARTAAARAMAAIATARNCGSRERFSGAPMRSARWLLFHSK